MSTPASVQKPDVPLHRQTLAVVIVSYNTSALTVDAAASAARYVTGPIVVVDNASNADEANELRRRLPSSVEIVVSPVNSGFAGGNNLALHQLLGQSGWSHVLLLNSDAQLTDDFDAMWRVASALVPEPEIIAARVDKQQPEADSTTLVESRGITLHRSLIASNRIASEEPLFGPTGALVILSRRTVEQFMRIDGEVFPAPFFCYAEDTDLCARAVLRGIRCEWLGDLPAALHVGQASSAGPESDFVAYHGLRNSIWMAVRCVPGPVLLFCSPWIVAAHAGIFVKYLTSARAGLLWRIWRDTARALPRLLRERRTIQQSMSISSREFLSRMSRSLYDPTYVRASLWRLFRRSG